MAGAVVAEHPTYVSDAARILDTLAPVARAHSGDADEYGLAVLNWFALRELPN